MFCAEFVGMAMICLHTKLHTPSPSSSLVIARIPKTEYRIHAAAMLSFYIVHKRPSNNSCIFFEDLFACIILIVTQTLLPPHKFVRPPCCYYWLQEIINFAVGISYRNTIFVPNFVKIGLLAQQFIGTRAQAAWWSHTATFSVSGGELR